MKDSFLQQTARAIIDKIDWKQLSRTTLVLPSHRAGLVLKDALLQLQKERHAPAVWAPQVLTLLQLQDQLSPLYAEDELFTVVRLYKLYRQSAVSGQHSDPMPLDMFYGFGRQMIADFTNIDASMPAEEVPNFFDNTIAAHELERWHLAPEVEERLRALINPQVQKAPSQSVREQFEQVWKQLFALYTNLRAEMTAEQKGYPGLRQRCVIEQWEDESIQSKIAGRTYVFVGFNYLLPVERELMEKLRDAGQALFFWDYVPEFQTNEKAFSFARLNSGILGNDGAPSPLHPFTPSPLHPFTPSPITVISCTSREAQAQYVHQWLQANYKAKGQKVGVVICDETMLEPVIYTLPAITLPGETEPEPINITKGFPLRNTQVYAEVVRWLNDRQRGDAEQVITTDLIDQLIAEVLIANSQEPTANDPSSIQPFTPSSIQPFTHSSIQPFTHSSLTWQELLILESEYQVRKVLNQVRQIVAAGLGDIPFTLKLLRLLIRRTMEAVTMPFHGEPVTDIQVMGVLETRLMDFDALLLLNVEEGVIPQKQADSSFIPYYLRKAYHMQTSDERATVYAYNFFRLLSRTDHATLLYADVESADGGKGMSRFIMQMIYSPEFEVLRKTLVEPSTLEPVAVGELPFECPSYGSVMRAGGSLSPSALNTYIACPRRFAWQYIQHKPAPPQEELVFLAPTMGTFVHAVMEYIYTHYFGCDNTTPKRVTPEAIEAVRTDKAAMQAALDYAYSLMPQFDKSQHAGENVWILSYADHILVRDREDARTGLQIWKLEQKYYVPIDIDGVGRIRIGGKVDRLDILGPEGNERIRVVDYKTGSYKPGTAADGTTAVKMTATWDEVAADTHKDYIRQTLIYSHAVAQQEKRPLPVEPNLFYCQRDLTTDVTTHVTVDNRPVHDVREVDEKMLETLRPKIQELLQATDFPMCEESDCKRCPYLSLCGRVAKEF